MTPDTPDMIQAIHNIDNNLNLLIFIIVIGAGFVCAYIFTRIMYRLLSAFTY